MRYVGSKEGVESKSAALVMVVGHSARGPQRLAHARAVLFVSALLGSGMVVVACGGKNDYVGAGVAAGLGVAAAGVNRAVTKECWAQCLHGRVCDHGTGMCVEHSSCGGRCGKDERCEEGPVARCVALFTALARYDAGADADAEPDAE